MQQHTKMLLVEDNPGDAFMVKKAFAGQTSEV
jgi:hypothetical protein